MCIHKYFIFKQCGHSFFAPEPLVLCAAQLQPQKNPKRSRREVGSTNMICTPTAHPYRTLLIHSSLCLRCELRRAHGLAVAEQNINIVTLPERKWKVQYQAPRKAAQDDDSVNGGWANGSDLDVNGFIKREEEEARRSKEAAEKLARLNSPTGSPASATSWKTSLRTTDSEEDKQRSRIRSRGRGIL